MSIRFEYFVTRKIITCSALQVNDEAGDFGDVR